LLTQITIIAGNSGNTYPSTVSGTVLASTTHLEYVGAGKMFSVSIPVHAGSAQIYIYRLCNHCGDFCRKLDLRVFAVKCGFVYALPNRSTAVYKWLGP